MPDATMMSMLSRGSQSKGNLTKCLERMTRGRTFREELMTGQAASSFPYSAPILDAVRLFDRLGIGYALIGGVAAMYYGRARFTEDVDFVASSGHVEVLSRNADVMRDAHFDPTCTYKLYHDSDVEIDIWKDEFADEII